MTETKESPKSAGSTEELTFDYSAEYPPATPAQIASFKKGPHSEVFQVTAHGIEFVIRPASETQWSSFIDMRAERPQEAINGLLLDCVVHPPAEKAREVWARWPAVKSNLADEVVRVSGGERKVRTKKL